MLNLKPKITAVTALSALVISNITPAFAASTIHISPRGTDVQVSEEVGVSGDSLFLGEIPNFNDFFDNFFNRRFKTKMNGAQEVPGPGDPDGEGKARIKINLEENQLCADLKVKDIDPATAAHIHHAPAGSAGAVVVVLPTPNSEGKAEGCMTSDHNLLKAIKEEPEEYYVNVHNNPYPNGAIRGQLSR